MTFKEIADPKADGWSMGGRRESEVSLGHGGVGGAGTLLGLAGVGGQYPER